MVGELGDQTLKDWILEVNDNENIEIDREKVYSMFLDICAGIRYLHGPNIREKLQV